MRSLSRRTAGAIFFCQTSTSQIYTLSLHDALPIFRRIIAGKILSHEQTRNFTKDLQIIFRVLSCLFVARSEEHTSELQSRLQLVCRLLLEKKKRLFGLTGGEGNHGEDVKEYYFYLD